MKASANGAAQSASSSAAHSLASSLPVSLQATRHESVAFVREAWHIVCTSRELRSKPIAAKLFGMPLCVFRDANGSAGVLLDRCPHRNVPLTEGRVVDGDLECAYHGWRFQKDGACTRVPGLCRKMEGAGRNAPAFAAREQDGFVWAWGQPGAEPTSEPYRFPALNDPGYTTVRRMVDFPGSLHATAENALDVPHTAFLHRGLFRGTGKTNEITAIVTRDKASAQAEYVGEPRPEGLAARILSPGGGVVVHYDRFLLPGVAQVEYKLGADTHFLVTTVCTPLEPFVTRAYAVISFRLRIPGWLIKPFLAPVAMSIFKQDARILAKQTQQIQRFGGESFVSTEVDILGSQIWRLLKRAADGRLEDDKQPWRKEIRLRV